MPCSESLFNSILFPSHSSHLLTLDLQRELHHRRLDPDEQVIMNFMLNVAVFSSHPLELVSFHARQVSRQDAINLGGGWRWVDWRDLVLALDHFVFENQLNVGEIFGQGSVEGNFVTYSFHNSSP